MLSRLDLLGPLILLRLKGRDRVQTNFGGFLCIFLFLVSISAFFGFGGDLYEKKNPRVTFNKNINDKPEFNLTFSSFLFTIYDQDTDLQIEELERKFTFQLEYSQFDGNGVLTHTKFYFEKCQEEILEKFIK